MGVALCNLVQLAGVPTPSHRWRSTQTERRLVVNVDAIWKIRQRDDIDIVGRVGSGRFDGRRLNQTGKALAIAIDRGINPVTHRDCRALVREASVDCRTAVDHGGQCQQGRSSGGLHRERNQRQWPPARTWGCAALLREATSPRSQ